MTMRSASAAPVSVSSTLEFAEKGTMFGCLRTKRHVTIIAKNVRRMVFSKDAVSQPMSKRRRFDDTRV